jgi:hypothetical protein
MQLLFKDCEVHRKSKLPKWKLSWECEGSFPHTFLHSWASSWPANLQALTLVASPRLGLQHVYISCHNPNFGLATKVRACKSARQEGSLRVTFHVPGSAKKCEGMNPHTPKGTSTLGVGVPAESRMFREQL